MDRMERVELRRVMTSMRASERHERLEPGALSRSRERATPAVMRAGLVDAGGEEAEIVGTGAVGEVGDACPQDGDHLDR